MRQLPTVFISIALASALAAQAPIQGSLGTVTAVGVHANATVQSVAANTAIVRPLHLEARERNAQAAESAALADLRAGIGAHFAWSGGAMDGGSAGTTAGARPQQAAHSFAFRLVAREQHQGKIVVLFGGDAHGAEALAAVSVAGQGARFRADGTRSQKEFPGLTVGPRGLQVEVTISGEALTRMGARAGYAASLAVMFQPDSGGGGTCTVAPGHQSCAAGGNLRGAFEPTRMGHALNLGLTGALPDAIGVTVVSPTPRVAALPSSRCVLLGQPLVAGVFRTDAHGDARTSLPVPGDRMLQFSVQQATVAFSSAGIQIATSNTLDVACRGR